MDAVLIGSEHSTGLLVIMPLYCAEWMVVQYHSVLQLKLPLVTHMDMHSNTMVSLGQITYFPISYHFFLFFLSYQNILSITPIK